jgi:hypothetical protein
MADKKISQLSSATTPLAGTEVLPIVQSGSTVKVSVDNLTTGKTVTASAFNSTSGYQFRGADATAYETLRYVGGTNNPGLFTSVDEASKKVRLNATGSIAAGHELCLGAEGTQDVFKVGVSNVTVSTGNAIFGGTGQRITGDMSNATLTNRLALQTSTTNGNTAVTVLPNGTSTTAQVLAYNNSDPTNASNGAIIATASAIRVSSGQSGTGTYLPLAFYTSGGEKAVVDTSGNLKVNNGNFIVGTAAKGIDFSANTGAAGMTSELLNWYEEGAFTPAITTSGSAPTITYTTQTGFYTRIGRLITATFTIQYSALSGGSGDVRFSLPFAGGAAVARGGPLYVFGVTPPANTFSLCLEEVTNGTSYVTAIFSVSGGAFVTMDVTHLPASTGSFRGQITYFA